VEVMLASASALGYCKLVTGKLLEGNNKPAANARTSASRQWSWRQYQLIAVSGKQTDQQQNRSNVNPLLLLVIKIIAHCSRHSSSSIL